MIKNMFSVPVCFMLVSCDSVCIMSLRGNVIMSHCPKHWICSQPT